MEQLRRVRLTARAGKHIRQSSEKRQTIPARFARGSRAARPTSENTAPRDAMKLNDAFPRRDRTYSLSAPSLVDENQPPTLPNMDDIFLHDAPIARRARARAMAPSRRLSRYVPLSIRSTDRLVDRGRGLRYGVQHPAQVQRQFDDREKPHCSTRERARGRKASDGDENALARAFGVSANALAGEIEFKRARAALNSRGGHDGRCTDGRRRGRRREEEGG